MKNVQTEVQGPFDRLIAEDKERGLRAAVYFKGELVVNASAGRVDGTHDTAVNERTLFPVFSCGKGVTATLIHRLVERGVLAYDQPIASVWPEFAAAGKDTITVRQTLDHTAGLQLVPAGSGYGQLEHFKKGVSGGAGVDKPRPYLGIVGACLVSARFDG